MKIYFVTARWHDDDDRYYASFELAKAWMIAMRRTMVTRNINITNNAELLARLDALATEATTPEELTASTIFKELKQWHDPGRMRMKVLETYD